MSGLTTDQIVYLTALLSTLAGIGITWLIYRGTDRPENPGEATVPDPGIPGEPMVDARGRTL